MTIRVITLVVGLAVAAPAAGARKAAPVPAAARAHFKQGRAFQEAGAWKDAIAEYEKAYALAPLPELLYNVAQCHRLGGDKPQAIAAYQRYLQAAPEGSFAEEARSHVAALRLKIQVEDAEAAKRRALEEAEAAKRRARELEEAKGKAAEEAYRRILRDQAEKERKAREAREATAAAARRAAEAKQAAAEQQRRRKRAVRTVGRPLRGVGIALQVLGPLLTIPAGIFLGHAFETGGDLNNWNNNGTRWSSDLAHNLEDSRKARAVATGLFAAAAAILGTGIALHVIGTRQRRRAERAAVTPWVGPGGGGLVLEGRF